MSERTAAEQPAAAAALRQMIMGYRVTQLIHVAARLGLADLMAQSEQPVSAMAEKVGADPGALYRLLRALSSIGVVAETREGSFQLTSLGYWLRRDVPGSLGDVAILYGDEWLWRAYGQLLYSVKTGLPAFDHVHDQPLFAYLDQHPAAASVFNRAMSGFSGFEAAAILDAYDFSAATTLIDVGGGGGTLLAAILAAYPRLTGILFDLGSVIDGVRGRWMHDELAARSQLVAGDFFAALPGGDVYLLKSVLHNWEDAAARRILQSCRNAISDHGRLLVVERVIPEGNEAAEAKLFDINMLVVVGGRERTEHEYRSLFEAADFRLTQVIPTQSALSIVEGVPVR